MFSCPRCGYATTLSANYKQHLNRKNECVDRLHSKVAWKDLPLDMTQQHEANQKVKDSSKTFKCEVCGQCFRSKQLKSNHKSRNHTIIKCKSPDDVSDIVSKLQGVAPVTIQYINNVTNNNQQTITQQNTQNVQNNNIRAFGNENLDYIMQKPEQLTKFFLNRECGVIKVAEDLHCNKSHPENKNVKITNRKQPFVQCFDGDKWQHHDKNGTLDEIINNVKNIIDEHVYEHGPAIKRNTNGVIYEKALHFLDELKMLFDDNAAPKHMRLLKDLRHLMTVLILKNSD